MVEQHAVQRPARTDHDVEVGLVRAHDDHGFSCSDPLSLAPLEPEFEPPAVIRAGGAAAAADLQIRDGDVALLVHHAPANALGRHL